MSRNSTGKTKGKKWIVVLSTFILFVVFRKQLMMGCVKVALAVLFSNQEFHYQSMKWEGESLSIHQVSWIKPETEISIDKLEMTAHGFFPIKIHCHAVYPHITIKEQRSNTSSSNVPLYLALPTRFLRISWEMEKGVLQLNEQSLLHFAVLPGADQLLETLSFYYDEQVESEPLFVAALEARDEQVQFHFSIQEEDCSRLLPLIALLHPSMPLEWQTAQGQVHLSGNLNLDSQFNFQEISCQGEIKELALLSSSEEVAFVAQQISVDLLTDSQQTTDFFWQQLKGTLLIERAEGYWTSLIPTQIHVIKGEVVLEPLQGPQLDLAGLCSHAGQSLYFELKGKGDIQRDNSFWSELNLTCSFSNNKDMECQAAFCRFAEGKYAIQLTCQHLQPEHLNFISTYLPENWQQLGWEEGFAQGKVTALIENNQLHTLTLEEGRLNHVRCFYPDQFLSVYAEHIDIEGECVLLPEQFPTITTAKISLNEVDWLSSSASGPFTHISHIGGEIYLERSEILHSRLSGECGGVCAELLVHDKEAPCYAELLLKGQAPQIATYSPLFSQPLIAQIALRLVNGAWVTEGEFFVSGEKVTAQMEFTTNFHSLSEFLFESKRQCLLKEGFFESELLTERSYAPVLKTLLPTIELKGDVLVKGNFDPSSVVIALLGSDCLVRHHLGEFSLSSFGENGARLMYDVGSQSWKGEIPIEQGRFVDPSYQLVVEKIDAVFHLDDQHLNTESFLAQSEGIHLCGNCELILTDPPSFHLETSQIKGNLHQAMKLAEHFVSVPQALPVKGDFCIPEKGFSLDINAQGTFWKLTCEGSHIAALFPEKHSLKDGSFKLSIDSSKESMNLERAHAVWVLPNGLPLDLDVPRLTAEGFVNTGLRFHINVGRENKTIVQVVGQAKRDEQLGWGFAFDRQSTHCLGTKLNLSHFSISKGENRIALELSPVVTGRELLSHLDFLSAAEVISLPRDFYEGKLDGNLQIKLSSHHLANELNFTAESRDLQLQGQKLSPFVLRGQKAGGNWKIEECTVGDASLKASITHSGDLLKCADLNGKWKGIALKGKAEIDLKRKGFLLAIDSAQGELAVLSLPQQVPRGTFSLQGTIKGDFPQRQQPLQLMGDCHCTVDCVTPIGLTAWTVKPVHFSYSSDQGYTVDDLSFQVKDRKGGPILGSLIATQVMSSPLHGMKVTRCDFSLTKSLLNHLMNVKFISSSLKECEYGDKLEGNVDLTYESSQLSCRGTLLEGKYGYKDQTFSLTQPIFRLEDGIFTFQARTQFSQQSLWASISMTTGKDTQGILRFTDHPKSEGLKFNFKMINDRAQWESIQGQCVGLSCDLKKNSSKKIPMASVLTGSIQVDASRLLPLLEKDQREKFQRFQLGKGYAWRGEVILGERGLQMTGELTGDECELFGYCFKQLRATLDVNPTHIILSNAQFSDEAGTISVKKIDIEKKTNWELYIPVVSVKEWRPSAMRKIGAPGIPLKPFVIRHFTLTNIHADLSKSDSLEARGQLTFTNQVKKESTIFDTPIELIKNFGLDPGLLTPVQGEIDVELRGDKLYLMAMKNTFSEAGRSEFYLAPDQDLSFIDLDGKIQIDLKMKQDVTFKITEPFMLTIRGTLEKPRYGLLLK